MENAVLRSSSHHHKDSDQFSTTTYSSNVNRYKNIKTNVGFESQELKSISTKELLEIKASVSTYLKSSQKYKYDGYYSLFQRIVKELFSRKVVFEHVKEVRVPKLLGKKKEAKLSVFNVVIPSFFNDISNAKTTSHNKRARVEEPKPSEIFETCKTRKIYIEDVEKVKCPATSGFGVCDYSLMSREIYYSDNVFTSTNSSGEGSSAQTAPKKETKIVNVELPKINKINESNIEIDKGLFYGKKNSFSLSDEDESCRFSFDYPSFNQSNNSPKLFNYDNSPLKTVKDSNTRSNVNKLFDLEIEQSKKELELAECMYFSRPELDNNFFLTDD